MTDYLITVSITVLDHQAALMNATMLGEATTPEIMGEVTLQIEADAPDEALDEALGRIRAAKTGDDE